MRKSAIFAAAFVLTLGLAQCKKEQPATPQNTDANLVHITVNVGNGSRADIADPSNSGHYTFSQGDKLYVGYNGACAGTLDYSASTSKFSGDISLTQSGEQPLHFYYLGGSLTPTVSGSEYTVDISDQTSNYPVISYGTSNKDYDGAGAYRTTLLNKCALVRFTLASGTTDAVTVGGMMTKATIDFTNPGVVTPSTAGEITLHTGASNTEKWAILLSQGAVANASVAIGNSYLGYTVGVPAIEDNDFAPEINTIDNSGTGNVVFLNKLTDNYEATGGQVLTGTLANNVKISIAAGAEVTLAGVNITNLGNNCNWAGINCPGDATIILKDGSTNTVCAGRGGDGYNNYPGIWIAPGKKLTIKGGGQLTAYSNNTNPYGAGIGGGYEIPCGSIEIQGGVITATGGENAAGIGSGYNASCDAITISGGTVTATGGENAAGIGSGSYASCDAITISGGTVTATGGKMAAGIGSGNKANCGAITITTGVTEVTAKKGGNGAPNSIGKGYQGSYGTVTIGCTLDGNGNPVGGQTGPISQSPYTYEP